MGLKTAFIFLGTQAISTQKVNIVQKGKLTSARVNLINKGIKSAQNYVHLLDFAVKNSYFN